LTVLFLYSFVIQDDYVKSWTAQREQALQMIQLTPDAERDSVIVLKLPVSGDYQNLSTAEHEVRAIGREMTVYETSFNYTYALNQPWPKLFVVYSDDWREYLKRDTDGLMSWTKPQFFGRWSPAEGRFRPGRFIVLEETESGRLIRRAEPILADGVQIVQAPPSTPDQTPVWAHITPSPLISAFLPDFVWKTDAGAVRSGPPPISPAPNSRLTTPRVTFTWPPTKDAVDYWIDVGTQAARGDISSGFTKGATSATIDISEFLTGKPIYVQLYPKFPDVDIVAGTGEQFAFTTRSGPGADPVLTSPSPGSVLTGSHATFTWAAVKDATDYWIDVGTAPAKGDLFGGYTKGATTATVVTSKQVGHGDIYVQLYSKYPDAGIVPGTGSQFRFRTTPAR
jgi:hypothetical protein